MVAIRAAIDLLDDDGALLIAVYPGHAEGTIEGELIEEELSKCYPGTKSRQMKCCFFNCPGVCRFGQTQGFYSQQGFNGDTVLHFLLF